MTKQTQITNWDIVKGLRYGYWYGLWSVVNGDFQPQTPHHTSF